MCVCACVCGIRVQSIVEISFSAQDDDPIEPMYILIYHPGQYFSHHDDKRVLLDTPPSSYMGLIPWCDTARHLNRKRRRASAGLRREQYVCVCEYLLGHYPSMMPCRTEFPALLLSPGNITP